MASQTGNPNLPNTAARYVAKALSACHPQQRIEMLRLMREQIDAVEAHLNVRKAA